MLSWEVISVCIKVTSSASAHFLNCFEQYFLLFLLIISEIAKVPHLNRSKLQSLNTRMSISLYSQM
jgi:hypothetical protein